MQVSFSNIYATVRVTSNIKDLSKKSFNNKASSMKMTSSGNKVLLFKNKDYKGGVMFRDGKENISILSSGKEGGQSGFGDTVSSVRIKPFKVKVYANIITTDKTKFPGNDTESAVKKFLEDMVAEASSLWEQGLLKAEISSTKVRKSSKFYNMDNEFLSLASKKWDKKKCINIYLVNEISGNTLGISLPPGIGNAIAVEYMASAKKAGLTLAHEIGHTLGIHHPSANKKKSNVMYPTSSSGTNLTDDQIDKVHRILAKNIFRKGLRSG